jgi:hypothetical protein
MVGGIDLDTTYPTDFEDVDAGAWYSDYIGYVVSKGIMEGYGDGSFHPTAQITRQEYAKVVSLLAIYLDVIDEVATGTPTFIDSSDISDWAVDYIYTAQSNGWMVGNGNGSVEPLRAIARDEAAKMLVELLGGKPTQEGIGDYKYIEFTDQPTDWAQYYVIEATNDHTYVTWNDVEYWIA